MTNTILNDAAIESRRLARIARANEIAARYESRQRAARLAAEARTDATLGPVGVRVAR